MPTARDARITSTNGHAPDASGPAAGPIDPATGQHTSYWVLTEDERRKGFVRPVRTTYHHTTCATQTSMGRSIAETYAAQPTFYGRTFCAACRNHFPVSEFRWVDARGVLSEEPLGT